MTASSRSETGSATVTTCLVLAALLTVTVLIAHVGTVVVARHRIQAAADLAALAAAGVVDSGSDTACARADEVVRRMRGRIQNCTVDGWDVTVVATSTISLGPFGARSVRAIARAGPVGAAPVGSAPASPVIQLILNTGRLVSIRMRVSGHALLL